MAGEPGVRIKLRRDTEAEWAADNPVLSLGETGWTTDTLRVKLGDGVTAWNDLPFAADEAAAVAAEVVRAMAAEAALQAEIDAITASDVETVAGVAPTGGDVLEASLKTALDLPADTNAELANRATDAELAAEAALARNADNLTSGTVADARIAATIARDSEVAAAVAAEAALRTTADTTLQTNINTEATTRGNADTALDGRLDVVEAQATIFEAAVNLGNTTGAINLTAYTAADQVFRLTATGNLTLAPAGMPTVPAGKAASFSLKITQDGTGGRTLTLDAAILSADYGVDPVLTTAIGAKDILTFLYDGVEWVVFVSGQAVA